jgi:hypothetical protein
MQEAVPVGTGAMAAILGLDAAKVIAGCAEVTGAMGQIEPEVVEAVNFNDPAQTVIAGSKAAVERACEVLKAAGAKRALPLPVSAPFHSSLMKPAAERCARRWRTALAAPQIPVVNNVDVAVQQRARGAIRDALYRQAFGPVRWVECVQPSRPWACTHVVECGPGKVLAGMVRASTPNWWARPCTTRPPSRSQGATGMSGIEEKQAPVALVTGASRGIGAPLRWNWPQRGYRVIGTATTERARSASVLRCPPMPAAVGAVLDVNDAQRWTH